jgi:hypothetical protein
LIEPGLCSEQEAKAKTEAQEAEELEFELQKAKDVNETDEFDDGDEVVVERETELPIETDDNLEQELEPELQNQA